MTAHENKSPRSPRVVSLEVAFARPANTDAYAAGDAVADSTSAPTALYVSGFGSRDGAGGRIVSAALVSSVAGVSNAAFDLLVFDEAYTPTNDNDAAAPTDAQAAQIVAALQFAATEWVNLSANKVAVKGGLNLPFVCKPDGTKLWLQLVARAAYAPASGETFTIRLGLVED